MNRSALRPRFYSGLCLAAACTSSAGPVTAAAVEDICRDAAAAALPAIAVTETQVGRIRHATFRMTELPRPDGGTAIVLTGIVAQVERGGEVNSETQDLAYVEDRECWDSLRRGSSGYFECYETDRGRGIYPALIRDTHSRAVLSVLAYMATGGETDAVAQDTSDGPSHASAELYFKTSAPSIVDRWYFCQTCGAPRSDRPEAVQSMAGMTFGRSANATYFLSAGGQAARLRDGETKAAYATCAAG